MTEKQRGADLEIEQNPDFQRRDWTFEKVGRWGMLVTLIASAAGLFGNGPLAQATIGDGDLRVEYERVARHGARSMLQVEFGGATTRDTVVHLWLDRRYVDGIDIEAVAPQPIRQVADTNRVIYSFGLASTGQRARVTFTFRPDGMGRLQARLGVENGTTLAFTQLILP